LIDIFGACKVAHVKNTDGYSAACCVEEGWQQNERL
jgi:hypothetical protein